MKIHLMTSNSLSVHFLQNHPQDAARTLEQFEAELIAEYLEHIPVKPVSEILRHMTSSKTVSCLSIMAVERSAAVLEHFSIERATMLLRRIKVDVRNGIIKAMSPLTANMIRIVLRYPAGTVGQLMNPNVFTVHEDRHIDEVIKVMQDRHDQVRSEIYVINDKQQLVGIAYTRDLLVAEPDTPIKKIMRSLEVSFPARSSLASVKDHPEWKYKDVLPVIDHAGMFIGVLKRGVMLDTLARDINSSSQQDDFMSTTMAIAELFWDACANLVAPEYENVRKEQQDERKQ
jgi:magnesium transporter